MHNIAEGFDSETNPEFIRFIRCAKRSCTEIQSEIYASLDEAYISSGECKDAYELVRRTRTAVRGFITYLKKFEERKATNREPLNPRTLNLNSYVVYLFRRANFLVILSCIQWPSHHSIGLTNTPLTITAK